MGRIENGSFYPSRGMVWLSRIILLAGVMVFCLSAQAQVADVKGTWDCPTQHSDNSPMTPASYIAFWKLATDTVWQTDEFEAFIGEVCVEEYVFAGLSVGDYHMGFAVVDDGGDVSDIATINFTHDGRVAVVQYPYPESVESLTVDYVQQVQQAVACETLTVKVKCKR